MLNIKYILFPNQETGTLEPLKNPNFFGPAWTVQTLIEIPTAAIAIVKNTVAKVFKYPIKFIQRS